MHRLRSAVLRCSNFQIADGSDTPNLAHLLALMLVFELYEFDDG